MSIANIDGPVIDLRGVSDLEALLELERSAAGRPGERIEVIADSPAFAVGLLRWCGEGYGRIQSVHRTKGRDYFRLQLPTREECAAVGISGSA